MKVNPKKNAGNNDTNFRQKDETKKKTLEDIKQYLKASKKT